MCWASWVKKRNTYSTESSETGNPSLSFHFEAIWIFPSYFVCCILPYHPCVHPLSQLNHPPYHSPISYVFSVKLEVNWQYAWGKVIRRWGVLVLWHILDHWLFGNQLQNKEAEGSSYREGSYTETPSTPKVRLWIRPRLWMSYTNTQTCIYAFNNMLTFYEWKLHFFVLTAIAAWRWSRPYIHSWPNKLWR